MSQNKLAHSAAKKPYARPQVTQLGGVGELTESNSNFTQISSRDGGSGFAVYAS